MTRQQRYRLKNIAKGLCEFCPRERVFYKRVCNVHRLYMRRWKAKALGQCLRDDSHGRGNMPYGEVALAAPTGR